MRRPSHFMLLFLICVGTPLFLWGEEPKPFPEQPPARLLDRGKGGLALETPAKVNQAPAEKPRQPEPAGPWTLLGTVTRETADAGQTLGRGVGLELIALHEQTKTLLSTICGPSGGYSWVGLLPGFYRIRALPDPNGPETHLPVAVELELPAPSNAQNVYRQDLTLPTPRKLLGSLVAGKAPRAGLTVKVSETGLHRGSAVSKTDGTFEIDGVGTGPFEIEVQGEGGVALAVQDVQTEKLADGFKIEVAVQ